MVPMDGTCRLPAFSGAPTAVYIEHDNARLLALRSFSPEKEAAGQFCSSVLRTYANNRRAARDIAWTKTARLLSLTGERRFEFSRGAGCYIDCIPLTTRCELDSKPVEVEPERLLGAEGAGAALIRRYYSAWNAGRIDEALSCIDEDCVYEDLSFSNPHLGKAEVKELFTEMRVLLPPGGRFVIEDVSEGDLSVGVCWSFIVGKRTITRGIGFYRLNPATGLVIFARDVPEPMGIKLGPVFKLVARFISTFRPASSKP